MRKILFYTDTPIAGGAEKQMLLLARNLVKSECQVKLVCSDYRQLDGWAKQFTASGFEVSRLKVWHKHDLRHYFGLKKILKKEHPDILHIHVWNPASCRYAFWAAHHTHTKTIITEHDPFPLHGFKNSLKKRFLERVDYVIAVSEANRNLLLQLYPFLEEKIAMIHNGIDLNGFYKELEPFTSEKRAQIRKGLFGIKDDEKIVLSIAALHPRKGLKYLLEAFAKVSQEYPKMKLVIVGEGPEKGDLEKFIKNLGIHHRAVLLGYQQNIPHILKSSDIFVLPSVKEAFGLVLLEAMAAEVPIIASRVGGIPEIIQDHENGELVEAGNSDSLAEKIKELLEHESLGEKFVSHGTRMVKNFSAQVMAQKTQQIYDKILL